MQYNSLGPNGVNASALIFSHCQWNDLYSYTNHKQTVQEENERKAAEISKRKQMSMEMAKSWDNTYVNIRKRRFEKRKERLKLEKEYRKKVFEELKKQTDKIKDEIKKKAKETALFNQDSTKAFHSAYRISEVLAERDAQIEFDKKIKKINNEIETKYTQSIMDDVKRYKKEQEEELRKKRQLKNILKTEAQQLYADEENRKKAEKERRQKEERDDMYIIVRQLQHVIENERKEVTRKKEMERKNLIENRELVEKNRLLAMLEEQNEDRAIQIISNGKIRIAKTRKQKEDMMLEEKRNRCQALSNSIEQWNRSKEENEEEIYLHGLEKQNIKDMSAREKEKQYKEMLRAERINAHLDHLKMEEERLAKERELLKWNILQRFRREELNNQFTEKMKEQRRIKLLQSKNMYKEQIKQEADRKFKEKELDLEFAKKVQEKWEIEDKDFLDYAYKVREESKNKGRSLYALDAAIYEFKKKNFLLKDVRNFIHDAKIKRPEPISEYNYKLVNDGDEEKYQKFKSLENLNMGTIPTEDCGCSQKANGI